MPGRSLPKRQPSAETDATALSPKMAQKVSDLPVADFQWWIHYIVGEVASEDLIGDPDEGLEFTEEFRGPLPGSNPIIGKSAAGNTIPAEEVHRRLGLDVPYSLESNTESAARDLSRLDAESSPANARPRWSAWRTMPQAVRHHALTGPRLRGQFRLRMGDYDAIYEIDRANRRVTRASE